MTPKELVIQATRWNLRPWSLAHIGIDKWDLTDFFDWGRTWTSDELILCYGWRKNESLFHFLWRKERKKEDIGHFRIFCSHGVSTEILSQLLNRVCSLATKVGIKLIYNLLLFWLAQRKQLDICVPRFWFGFYWFSQYLTETIKYGNCN